MEPLHKDDEKIRALSAFMAELLAAGSTQEKRAVYQRYESLVDEVRPIDLFYLDMYKQDSDLDVEDIKDSAGKFVNVFYHGLERHRPASYDSVFFQSMIREHRAIEEHFDALKPMFKKDLFDTSVPQLIDGFERALVIESSYVKQENILFPAIEPSIPSTRPLEVLWSLHDDARSLLKQVLRKLRKTPPFADVVFDIGELYNLVYGIHTKRELILFPVADKLLDRSTKDRLYAESLAYGYAFIETPQAPSRQPSKPALSGTVFTSSTGHLDAFQLDGVMRALPLDITFVDKDDKVAYFNDRKERHFPRNPSIIGRLVTHCHPPKSVAVVEDILDAFKASRKDRAEFWIEMGEAFLYITYYAVRDADGTYLGTLEVSQDVSHIRSLSGQRRLLQWDQSTD